MRRALHGPDWSDRPSPVFLVPMDLTPATSPPEDDERWGFEVKWDGFRVLCHVAGGRARMWSRHGKDHTAAFPEIQALARALRAREALLDGEMVSVDPKTGRPSFARIRQRFIGTQFPEVLARRWPATMVAFDLLALDGRSVMEEGYAERRARLDALELRGPRWLTTAMQVGRGADLIEASRAMGLEGVVAKRLTSRYRPGMRSSEWLKLKNYERESYVVGGWLPAAAGGVEALFVGTPDERGRLVFDGTVSFGLQHRGITKYLTLLAADESPFREWQVARRSVRWVRPLLAANVRSLGRDAGVLREAILEGLGLAGDRL